VLRQRDHSTIFVVILFPATILVLDHNFDKLSCWCCNAGYDFGCSLLFAPFLYSSKLSECFKAFYAYPREFYFGLSIDESDFNFLNSIDLIKLCYVKLQKCWRGTLLCLRKLCFY